MSETENIEKVVRALEKVPPKKLSIIELANSIPVAHGMLDIDALSQKQREVNLAIAEAKSYGAHTIMAVDCLVRIRGKGG